jgi:DNA polymerase elongation subunit (family B)
MIFKIIVNMNNEIFTYQWLNEDDDDEKPFIRIYGIDINGETVCLRVKKFYRYFYLELSDNISAEKVAIYMKEKLDAIDTLLEKKHHLYYYSDKKFRFLKCSFTNRKSLVTAARKLKYPITVGGKEVKLKVHEQMASPCLQLITAKNLQMSGWLKFKGKEIHIDKITRCDREYIVKYMNLSKGTCDKCIEPNILAFDLEVNSMNPNAMPSNEPGDVIFQISCVFRDKKILLSLGDAQVEDVEVRLFESEKKLLKGFVDLVMEAKPNVLAGYNILGFDIPYMMKRYHRYYLIDEFKEMGFHLDPAKEKTFSWSSSAFKDQNFSFINWEGILLIDLLPIVMRDYKLDNYKLQTIATKFTGEGKDPLTAKDIFQAFKTGELSEVGKYCIKDSVLVFNLLDKFQTWVALSEMSKVCNVGMFFLYTKGQQLKVYSQVYKHCHENNILVDTDGYIGSLDENYVGAHVIDPVPGFYRNVIPFDFSSLYPSIIIAYNICYSTIVIDDDINPDLYNEFTWEDHVGCEHDPKIIKLKQINAKIQAIRDKQKELREYRNSIKAKDIPVISSVAKEKSLIQKRINEVGLETKPLMEERDELIKAKTKFPVCSIRKFKFYKPEVRKGVMPTIITNLLTSRKLVRAKIKETDDPLRKIVYDKQQLAYKVSANSMYGGMGVKRGMLPFNPGAMTVTYLGRTAIEKAAEIIQSDYNGTLVYGDTDSNYVIFPEIQNITKLWDHAVDVAAKVSNHFPPPMKLEFENAVYAKFLILSKKRYMHQQSDRNGKIDQKIGKKGVLLARRDNALFTRLVYEEITKMIFDGHTLSPILDRINEILDNLFQNTISPDQYIITKSVSNTEGEIDKETSKLGSYKVKELSSNDEERMIQLAGKTEREFYISSCPAQVRLAEKMRKRNCPVAAGSRLEYVVIKMFNAKNTGDQIEEYEYYKARKHILRIDPVYYLQSLINPTDQLLKVALGTPKVMSQLAKCRLDHQKMLKQYSNCIRPAIVIK